VNAREAREAEEGSEAYSIENHQRQAAFQEKSAGPIWIAMHDRSRWG